MKTPPDEHVIPGRSDPKPVSAEERQQELGNLLHSGIAREHTHLHDLLSYLGTKSLSDSGEPLKEYVIGVEALRKPSGYDPRLDPTVRVEVAKLRKKLQEYYQGPGADHPVKMMIPRGGYAPAYFREVPPARHRPRSRFLPVAAAVTLVATVALVVLVRANTRPAQGDPELRAFWAPFLADATPTLLVYGTPLFVKMNRTYYRDPHINSPEEGAEQDGLQRVLRALEPSETRPVFTFTGSGEAEALFLLTRLLAPHNVALAAEPSSSVSWEDLKHRNVILLGGRKFIPMILDLPHKRKFEALSRAIVNLHPQGKEPAEYRTVSRTPHGEITHEYALISVYPGISAGTVLMAIESSSTEGTLLATEFITRAETVRELIGRNVLPIPAGKAVRPFQVVVGAKLNKGVPVSLFYVNHAIVP
jgi:hypothetical protein